MISKNKDCTLVLENIAWGRNLSKEDQVHILNCIECSSAALSFEELDSLVANEAIHVPIGFADKVMKQIDTIESSSHRLNNRMSDFITTLFDSPIFRWSIGGTSFLLAFSAH